MTEKRLKKRKESKIGTFSYPVFLDISGKRCVVVGGGEVAYRKTKTLLHSGAAVTVVAPSLHPGLVRLGKKGEVRCFRRKFAPSDLEGAILAVCATDDENLNARVAGAALKKGALVNVVDRPALCSFIVPSVFRCGDLTMAISTGGASPALAKKIRLDLGKHYGKDFSKKLEVLRNLRLKMIATRSEKDRKAYYKALGAIKL